VGTIKMALISLRMLLESPNPKDPQDAEVAKMLMEDPDQFAVQAHEWAVKYAGAPRRDMPKHNYQVVKPPEKKKDDPKRCVADGEHPILQERWTWSQAQRYAGVEMAWLTRETTQVSGLQQGARRPVRQHGIRRGRRGGGLQLRGYRPEWWGGLRTGGSIHG